MPGHIQVHLHWHTEPGLLLALLLVVGLYSLGIGPLRYRLAPGQTLPGAQAGRFGLGLLVLYIAIASPLDAMGETYLFSAHMVQHMALIYAVPLLCLSGVPGWLAGPLVRLPGVTPAVRFCTRPVVALTVGNLVFAAWHIPGLYEWALRDRFVHNLEHVTFLGTALLMWWPVVSPVPHLPRLSPGAQVLYLLALSIGQIPVFAYLTFSSVVLYPTYAMAPRLLPLSPLEDQQVGGMIMKVASMAVMFTALAVVFKRWYGAESPSPTATTAQTSA